MTLWLSMSRSYVFADCFHMPLNTRRLKRWGADFQCVRVHMNVPIKRGLWDSINLTLCRRQLGRLVASSVLTYWDERMSLLYLETWMREIFAAKACRTCLNELTCLGTMILITILNYDSLFLTLRKWSALVLFYSQHQVDKGNWNI